MFSWSRGEMWLAIVVSALIVAGGLGHLWLSYARLQGASVIVQAAEGLAGERLGQAASGGAPQPPAQAEARGEEAGPREGEETSNEMASSSGSEGAANGKSEVVDTRININTATVAELQRLPGIGPTLAARIVAYRETWGPFAKIDDIMEVPGIGPRRFEEIQHLIKVE